MAPSPQKFREIVFQLLYRSDFVDAEEEDTIDFMMREFALSKGSMRMAQEKKELIRAKLEEIDQKIATASSSYSFDRIPRIERNILRLGIFELFYDSSLPPKVAIAEAIRLTRKYATPEGGTFVNAILDSLYKQKQGEPLVSLSTE
jgi:N utilization substance protein B